ncbi:MAG: hypothetical protein WAV13_03340 [Thermodesulfovibrionales bacterium]
MKLQEIIDSLSLKVETPSADLNKEVSGAYVSDMMSDVMGNAKDGFLWITIQVHLNIIAVASLKNLSGIILVNSRVPAEDTLKKAIAENIPIMTTPLSAFDLVGMLYGLGLRCR